MLCFSVMTVRKKWYEFFLVVHIIGAVLFLVFLYGSVVSVPNDRLFCLLTACAAATSRT